MRLSEIPAVLREIGVSPVKTLGQNFLHDRNLARWIVDQANITADDYVVEVGPGLGALTEFVVAKGARLLAIEKDKRLVDFLQKRFAKQNVEIVHADAIEFDPRTLYAHSKVKLIGNLPYYISSQLLIKFLDYPSPISLWLLMLQKELAARLGATPRTRDYGALTLHIQLHYRVEYLRTISANVFVPKPDVDSAIVRITRRRDRELSTANAEMFEKLVRLGFSQRRKQLGKLIRQQGADWDTIVAELGLNPRARAEELSLNQWIDLTNRVAPITPARSERDSEEQFQVVDRQDIAVGSAPRSQVHANNLLHRAVHILIFNPQNEVFLQLRSRWKDRHPQKWDSSAAGHVDAGESYEETAVRELQEELGIETALEKVAKLPASDRTGFEFICLYRGSYDGRMKLNRTEIEAGRYFPPALIDKWIAARPDEFAPGFLECWKIWREKDL